MATSSITKNFVMTEKAAVESFLNAYEASEQEKAEHPFVPRVNCREVTDRAEIREIMKKWKEHHESR